MQIDKDIKFKSLSQDVKEHFMFIDTSQMKGSVAAMTFVMLDLLIIVPLFFPLIYGFLYIILPLLIILHVWMVRLLLKNSYSTQFETVLFIGSFGLISGVCFFLLAQKMAYYYVGISFIGYYITTSAMLIFIVFLLIRFQINKYKNVENDKIVQGKSNYYIAAVTLVPALGYMFAQSIKQSEGLSNFVLVLIFNLFAYFYSYVGAKFFHRYFFMKANMRFVHFQKPFKKERKRLEDKGVIIK